MIVFCFEHLYLFVGNKNTSFQHSLCLFRVLFATVCLRKMQLEMDSQLNMFVIVLYADRFERNMQDT